MNLLTKNNAFCLLIDVQEKLYPAIFEKEILLKNIQFLLNGFSTLEIPVLATEQYPQGLGKTIVALTQHQPLHKIFEKQGCPMAHSSGSYTGGYNYNFHTYVI